MDMTGSILLPLSNVAKDLAAIAKKAADSATDFDSAALRHDFSDTAQHLIDIAGAKAQAAREVATPRIKQTIASAQERLYALRDMADEQARMLAKTSAGKAIARHPIAAAVAVASAGYLILYAWKRYRAAAAKQATARARPRARATNGSGKTRTSATRKAVHVS